MTDKNEALMAGLRYRLGKASGGQAIVDEDDLAAVIDIVDKAGSLIEMLSSELRAAHAALDPKVKMLEWRWRADMNGGQFEADCALGRYKVWGAKHAVWQWSTHLGRSDLKSYLSADDAKAAAQADFEAIIHSALTTLPHEDRT